MLSPLLWSCCTLCTSVVLFLHTFPKYHVSHQHIRQALPIPPILHTRSLVTSLETDHSLIAAPVYSVPISRSCHFISSGCFISATSVSHTNDWFMVYAQETTTIARKELMNMELSYSGRHSIKTKERFHK